jgi:hypothetical protein
MTTTATGTKFPDAVSAIMLPAGAVWDGSADGVAVKEWEATAPPPRGAVRAAFIDIAWYEAQRVKLRAHTSQVVAVNEALSSAWYRIIRRSLADLPIQRGGRSILNPEYGEWQQALATALGLAPRTFSTYRTAVSRIRDEAHFRELIKGTTWAGLVFCLNASVARRVSPDDVAAGAAVETRGNSELPLVKKRFVVAVPTQTSDFLMDNGLAAHDVTAVIVSYLRQPKVQRALLNLFRTAAAAERDDAA